MMEDEKLMKFIIDISKLLDWTEEVGSLTDSMSCIFSFIYNQMYHKLEEDPENPECVKFFEQTLMHVMKLHDELKEMGKKAGLA